MSEKRERNNFILGCGTKITGKIFFDKPVVIEGAIDGEVHSNSEVHIAKPGQITGAVFVHSLIIDGSVSAKVYAEQTIHISASGKLIGSASASKLQLSEGGIFDGEFIRLRQGYDGHVAE